MTAEELLTVAQIAAQLQVHPETVRRWINAGRLSGIRLGGDKLGWRVRASDLTAFVASGASPMPS